MLFVEGDNDTYPLWFLQQVDSLRRDVTVVTIPLLGAAWYGAELSRRYDLLPHRGGAGDTMRVASLPATIARRAHELGRPVAAAVSVDRATRDQLGGEWVMSGLVYIEHGGPSSDAADPRPTSSVAIDSVVTRSWAQRIESWRRGRTARESTDTMDDYALGLLSCPRLSLIRAPSQAQADSLASVCNRR